jgi:hypothetical protein
MILVTGTMRSGTSMWMQILIAAGFPHIGEAFPEPWGKKLHAANSRGFFESRLVGGVYHATNPHPETGAYLFPQQTRRHVTKVFIPGLVRSDSAFIGSVVATVREWRVYAASMARMRSILDEDREALLFDVPLSPALRWWMENFGLIRDIATRRYAAHVTTYERLLTDPESEIATVLKWLGEGDLDAATAAVEPSMQTQGLDVSTPSDISPRHAVVFDDLYQLLHEGRDLAPSFVELLNRTDAELRPRISRVRDAARTQIAGRLAAATLSEAIP